MSRNKKWQNKKSPKSFHAFPVTIAKICCSVLLRYTCCYTNRARATTIFFHYHSCWPTLLLQPTADPEVSYDVRTQTPHTVGTACLPGADQQEKCNWHFISSVGNEALHGNSFSHCFTVPTDTNTSCCNLSRDQCSPYGFCVSLIQTRTFYHCIKCNELALYSGLFACWAIVSDTQV